jgi:hypothetical protein
MFDDHDFPLKLFCASSYETVIQQRSYTCKSEDCEHVAEFATLRMGGNYALYNELQ